MDLTALSVIGRANLPLAEVSGLAHTAIDHATERITAVGDRASKLAWASCGSDLDDLQWVEADLPAQLADHAQWEAVATDPAGRVVLVREEPAELVSLAVGTLEVETLLGLTVPPGDRLGEAWTAEGSGPESLVLLPHGRVLVAREKDPAVIVEFAPAGSGAPPMASSPDIFGDSATAVWEPPRGLMQPVAHWWPDEAFTATLPDVADLAVGPDRQLYALSDQGKTLARVRLDTQSQSASVTAGWQLPGDVKSPEGLAFLATGQPLVALDRKKSKGNLLLLDEAVAMRDVATRRVTNRP